MEAFYNRHNDAVVLLNIRRQKKANTNNKLNECYPLQSFT